MKQTNSTYVLLLLLMLLLQRPTAALPPICIHVCLNVLVIKQIHFNVHHTETTSDNLKTYMHANSRKAADGFNSKLLIMFEAHQEL